jgi:hypothetical protein
VRLHEGASSTPLTYYVDRCLGTGDVPNEISLGLIAGENVQIHDDLLPQNAPDQAWLNLVGKNAWVGFTKDDAIRRRPAEIGAILAAMSAVFIFANANVTGMVIAGAFRTALPGVRKAVRRFDVPMIGRVNRAGEVSILWHTGKELPKAIRIR